VNGPKINFENEMLEAPYKKNKLLILVCNLLSQRIRPWIAKFTRIRSYGSALIFGTFSPRTNIYAAHPGDENISLGCWAKNT